MAKPPVGQLLLQTGLQMAAIDPPKDKTSFSFAEVREIVRKLKSEKVAGICNISVQMLRVECEAIIHWLHAVLSFKWYSSAISSD